MISVYCKSVVSQSQSIVNSVQGAILYRLRNIEFVSIKFSKNLEYENLWMRISTNLFDIVCYWHFMGRNNAYHYQVIQQKNIRVFNMKRAAVVVTIYKVAMSSNARYYEVHLCPTFYTYKSFIRFNSV